MKKNNKGFSMVELIIAMAIIAVLVTVIAPSLLNYINQSKRTTDATNAEKIVDVMRMIYVTEGSEPFLDGTGGYVTAIMWDKNSPPDGNDIFARMFQEFGGVPISKTNPNYLWRMFYSFDAQGLYAVKGVYLVDAPGATIGYELYPDPSKFIEKNEKVTVPY